jgi:hypothetical protein
MKNSLLLLLAFTTGIFAQQQPQLSALKWTEPVPAQVVGQIPPGWQIVELKVQKITHGPFQLPDGRWVTLTTPKYVLQPMLDSGSLYLLEPGFDPKDPSGNPRAGTLSNILYTEMEALRISSENLRPIMAQFAKVQAYAQQEDPSSSGPSAQTHPLEEQVPQLPGSNSAAPAPTPIPLATSSPSPVQPAPSPLPSPAGTASLKSDPTPGHHGKKALKKSSTASGSPPSPAEASPTPTPKKP